MRKSGNRDRREAASHPATVLCTIRFFFLLVNPARRFHSITFMRIKIACPLLSGQATTCSFNHRAVVSCNEEARQPISQGAASPPATVLCTIRKPTQPFPGHLRFGGGGVPHRPAISHYQKRRQHQSTRGTTPVRKSYGRQRRRCYSARQQVTSHVGTCQATTQ